MEVQFAINTIHWYALSQNETKNNNSKKNSLKFFSFVFHEKILDYR